MSLSIIVAMADRNVIGIENRLPWHLPADLRYFRSVTMGKPVIMGRKTFDSIGHPLPGRRNIVITRDPDWRADGVDVVNSPNEARQAAGNAPETMVIGGAQIYRDMLPLVDRLYITEVACNVEGDTFFPMLSKKDWRETSRESHAAGNGQPAFAFVVYERARRSSS